MNPICPNGCHKVMRIKKRITHIGIEDCPKCHSIHHKPIILTRGKESLHRCLECRNEYKPRIRQGLKKFWVCSKCHVSFGVGDEVIMPKQPPKTQKQIIEDLGLLRQDPATKGFKRVYGRRKKQRR